MEIKNYELGIRKFRERRNYSQGVAEADGSMSYDNLETTPPALLRGQREPQSGDHGTVTVRRPAFSDLVVIRSVVTRDLRKRTKDFALRIVRMFVALPKTPEARVLGSQVLRSGTSIGANYREAFRGRSRAEFIAKCGDSLRELEETAYWLELLVDGQIISATSLAPLSQECDELTAIFVTIIKKCRTDEPKPKCSKVPDHSDDS
jgi:four helix bundle protein